MTITAPHPATPVPTPSRRRSRLWWLLLLALLVLPLWRVAADTWESLDVYQAPFHGLDTRARNLAGQSWTLDRTASSKSWYSITGLESGDSVKTWSDVSQDGHFGIGTRIDSVDDPAGPITLNSVSVTDVYSERAYPANGSPIGDQSQLPVTLTPGTMVQLDFSWTLKSCAAAGAEPRTFRVDAVDLNETILGVHRTRTLPLGYTLSLTEPTCEMK